MLNCRRHGGRRTAFAWNKPLLTLIPNMVHCTHKLIYATSRRSPEHHGLSPSFSARAAIRGTEDPVQLSGHSCDRHGPLVATARPKLTARTLLLAGTGRPLVCGAAGNGRPGIASCEYILQQTATCTA